MLFRSVSQSRYLPNDEMPKTEDGEFAEICLNPLGVYGRMNVAQCYEQELNFFASEIVKQNKKDKKLVFNQKIMEQLNFAIDINPNLTNNEMDQIIDTSSKIINQQQNTNFRFNKENK